MDRSYQSGASGSAPTAPAVPSTGYPTAGNPGTGTPATKPGPYWYHMITEELVSLIAAAGLVPDRTNLQQVVNAVRKVSGGVVASARNLVGKSAGSVKTASWSVDELVAETELGEVAYKGKSLALPFNGATTGAGGMDAGSTPATSTIYIYAIYNPTTTAWATLGTTAGGGSIYSGAAMPAGYTASCLIGSFVTNASGQFVEFVQYDRRVFTVERGVLSSVGQVATLTSLSLSAVVPANAKTWSGNGNININAPCTMSLVVAGTSTGVGVSSHGVTATGTMSQGLMKTLGEIPIVTPQTTYYSATVTGGSSMNVNITCTGYTF